MSIIVNIHARQILDSRGTPTIEVDVMTANGLIGRAAVPSGASTGQYEAMELRDGDKKYYNGKSVYRACNNVNDLIDSELKNYSVFDQAEIDHRLIELDGTENKSKLGANAILGVSLAVARAASQESQVSLFRYLGGVSARLLPVPQMNILNGGKHADNKIDFQEFMIMPVGASSFSEALRIGAEVFYALKEVLKKAGYSTNVGDEGGFAPDIQSNEEAIETVLKAIEKAGYKIGSDIHIALDAAASEMFEKKKYKFYKSSGKSISTGEMIDYWKKWVDKYPIASIEDALDEDDWSGWADLNKAIGHKIQLVGDDLFVTNTKRLARGVKEKASNSILIKVNQIGTLTETIDAVEMAHRNDMTTIISHRSGETEDTFIADLAVALRSGQIKTGSLSRTDRVAKYNQLLRIEEELDDQAVYAGKFFKYA